MNPLALKADYFKVAAKCLRLRTGSPLQRANKADEKSKSLQWVKNALTKKGNFDRIFQNICEETVIKGSCLQYHMTNHYLRTSMMSPLIDSGYSDASSISRTGHTRVATLASYHPLNFVEGLSQKFGALNSKFTTFSFKAADLDALPKSNLEPPSDSENMEAKTGCSFDTVKCAPTAQKSFDDAVYVTTVQPRSALPKTFASTNQFGGNTVSINLPRSDRDSTNQSDGAGLSTNQFSSICVLANQSGLQDDSNDSRFPPEVPQPAVGAVQSVSSKDATHGQGGKINVTINHVYAHCPV